MDFIQRQSTNDVSQLAPGRLITTVLTNASARILDVLQLLQEDEETIGAVALRPAGTTQFLKKRIFFMDKVTIEDRSTAVFQVLLEGPGATDSLHDLGLPCPAIDEVITGEIAGVSVRVLGQPGLAGTGYRVLADASQEGLVLNILNNAGLSEISTEDYEIMRLEAGQPGGQTELIEDYTPLEARLRSTISDTKGCYTGQEVIARQITYDKISRQMVGLTLQHPVAPGASVTVDGKNVGSVTSAAVSPTFGPIALAMVRRPHFEPGTAVTVTGEEDSKGEVTDLPFNNK